jgi:hypothetical protein
MASWIAHLRVAETLLGKIPGLPEASFAVGNIAPDSGIPDEKWEKFTPPPEVTHFQNLASKRRDLADLEFFRRYLLPLRGVSISPSQFAFRMGYFCHLVTDNLWSQEVGRPTKTRFASDFAADANFIWKVKEDWYGLDFVYVRDFPKCLFWRVFLTCQAGESDLDFLPVEALRQRITYIQEFYQKQDAEVQAAYQRPYIYLSANEMDRFIETAAGLFTEIYQRYWVEGIEPVGASAVLSSAD